MRVLASLKPLYWHIARRAHSLTGRRGDSAPARWETAPPEIDSLEAKWWQEFGWLDNEIQSPSTRRILRKHYLQDIIDNIPTGGTIVDFGCGTGWLSILLSQLGASRVIGVDISPSQLAVAKRCIQDAELDDVISLSDSLNSEVLANADIVVFHGVLHHMTWSEIDAVFDRLHSDLNRSAKIYLIEPYTGRRSYFPWSLLANLIASTARVRGISSEEARLRKEWARAGQGPRYPGHGISPKEMPFRVNDLAARLAPKFDVTPERPVLFKSILVAIEFSLLERSYPSAGRFCLRYLLPMYGAWERFSFHFAPRDLWRGWMVCLCSARLR